MRGALLVTLASLVLGGTACGDPDVREVGHGGGDVVASCGDVRFPALPADPSSFPPLGSEAAAVDLATVTGEGTLVGYEWFVAHRSDSELVLFGRPPGGGPVHHGDDPPFADATFARRGERWVAEGWGQCRVEVTSEGWGNARFVLHPDVAPSPSSTTLTVLATERACASGRAPGGREVRSVVVSEDASSVHLLVLVEPAVGDQECPGNPSFRFEVDLGAPLGDRAVYDASLQPALARPWPPTASSLASPETG